MPYRKMRMTKYKYTKRKNDRKPKNEAPKRKFKAIKNYGITAEPFPRVLKTTMKYALVNSLSTNAFSTAVSQTFRLNSIWDPDFTLGGNTVVGHNVMSSIYGRYLVTGAKVNIRFYDPSSDAVRVGCRLRINGTNPTSGQTMTALVEQPLTYQSGLANSGRQVKVFNLWVPAWRLLGVSKLEYMANTTKYSSPMNGDPAEDKCLLDIFAVEGTNVSRSVAYAIKIVYYVQLYDRLPLTST